AALAAWRRLRAATGDGAREVSRAGAARPPERRCHRVHRGDRLRKLDGGETDELVLHEDELVALERAHGVGVQRREWARALGHEPQGQRPPLPEGAFEAALLAKRLVAPPARRARVGQWTRVTARDPCN